MVPRRGAVGLWLRLLLSLVLGAALLAALLGHIEVIPRSWDVAPWAVLAYLASLAVYFLARAGRWYFLLRPLGAVSPFTATVTALAGILWIMLLPFRLGELARPLFLAQTTTIRASEAVGTVALERVIDGLMVCALFFASAALLPADLDLGGLHDSALVVTAVFATGLVVLLAAARWPGAVGRAIGWIFDRLAPPLSRRLTAAAEGVAHGLRALPSVGPLAAFLAATMVYWAANVLGCWVLAHGCGLPLSVVEMAGIVAIINIVLLVPAGPAQVGSFQAGVVLGLSLFVTDDVLRREGSTFVFILYAAQASATVALGLWAQRRLALDWGAVLRFSAAGPDQSDTAASPPADPPADPPAKNRSTIP